MGTRGLLVVRERLWVLECGGKRGTHLVGARGLPRVHPGTHTKMFITQRDIGDKCTRHKMTTKNGRRGEIRQVQASREEIADSESSSSERRVVSTLSISGPGAL